MTSLDSRSLRSKRSIDFLEYALLSVFFALGAAVCLPAVTRGLVKLAFWTGQLL